MAQSILEIKSGETTKVKANVNLLPCRIQHDGPVDPIQGYWRITESEGKQAAYFRGRKLQGTSVKVPEGYKGVVVEKGQDAGAKDQSRNGPNAMIGMDAGETIEKGRIEVKAEFDKLVIWGHEATADASSDPYVRGMEEWVSLADQIHSY